MGGSDATRRPGSAGSVLVALVIVGCVVAWGVASLIVAHAVGVAVRLGDRLTNGKDAPHPYDPSA